MAIRESAKLGRRAVLGGAIGGAAVLAVKGMGAPDPVRAADGGAVVLGAQNDATNVTAIRKGPGFVTRADLAGATFGVAGTGFVDNSLGVYASAQGIGGIGVKSLTIGHHSQIAVLADTTFGNGEGFGVKAMTKNGIGVYAQATGGYALQVQGRAVFNRSGKTTIAGGNSTKTVSGHLMTSSTVVVATVQGNPAGVWVRSVSVSDANETFTIRLNKAAPTGGVVVGYFIVN